MAWDTLPITASFASHTLWKRAGYFRITPVQVLQRTLHFTVLSATDAEGVTIKLKVDRSLLPLFHTAHSSVIMFWYECGNLRFGCQRPLQAFPEDEFLTKDQPNIPRSTWDPTYKPMMEGFEPWAQHFESSELCAGYGLVSEADELHEPWMAPKLARLLAQNSLYTYSGRNGHFPCTISNIIKDTNSSWPKARTVRTSSGV